MLYLHDVWVNWFEGEENGYSVCQFFEWRKEDSVALLDQVPVLKVEPGLYQYIENQLLEVPSELLQEIYQKAYIRKNHERVQMEYCFVVTDGEGILAVDTIGYYIPIRKSRLIPRQEQAVYEMVEHADIFLKGWKPDKEYIKKEHHILSPSYAMMAGLTRRERQLKQLMFMALDQLYSTKNAAEIRYWYTEWAPHLYEEIQRYSFKRVWEGLFMEVQVGWSNHHEQFCERLIKGQPFFEKLWELEKTEWVAKDYSG